MGARLEGEKIYYFFGEWFVMVERKMSKLEGPVVSSLGYFSANLCFHWFDFNNHRS